VYLDPEYQAFVTNMNAPLSASEALPNAETMLEEIEKKQRDIHGKRNIFNIYIYIIIIIIDSKHKIGVSTTPLLEFLKRKREERKQV